MINRLLEGGKKFIETSQLIVLIACMVLGPVASMIHHHFMKMSARGNERRNPKRRNQTNRYLKTRAIVNLKLQDSLACNPTMEAMHALIMKTLLTGKITLLK